MNAKEYDMMIFIGAGQGFPGTMLDVRLPGNFNGFVKNFGKTGEPRSKGLTILGSLCSFFYVCFRKDPDLKNTIVVLE